MLEFEAATKRFGALAALDGCSFTASPGRLTGFVGPNGAGKTTAMRAIFGLVDLDAPETDDPRDYDVEHYVRVLRETFAARLARAFRPQDFAAVFEDPDQLSLLPPSYESMRPILTSFRSG